MLRCIVFDLDGTLLDTLPDLAAAGNAALRHFGLPTHPTAAYRRMVGNGISNLCLQILPDSLRDTETHQRVLQFFESYYQNHLDVHTVPYDGIDAMLKQLDSAGFQLAVLSNKPDAFVRQLVGRFFAVPFAVVQGALPQFPHKPQPDSLLHLLRQCGAQPGSALYCGDSEVDIQTASNAGLPCAAVSWGFRPREELAALHPAYLIDRPGQLTELLLQQKRD